MRPSCYLNATNLELFSDCYDKLLIALHLVLCVCSVQQVKDVGVGTHYIRSKRLMDAGKGLEQMKLSKEDPVTDAENEVELALGEVEVVGSGRHH